jgi:hypothetical protein
MTTTTTKCEEKLNDELKPKSKGILKYSEDIRTICFTLFYHFLVFYQVKKFIKFSGIITHYLKIVYLNFFHIQLGFYFQYFYLA